MPNRALHVKVGLAAGTASATYAARQQPAPHLGLEMLGGALGGYVGARAPDIIDPPTSPRHRSVGHAIVPMSLAGGVAVNNIASLQQRLRAEADRRAARSQAATSTLDSFWHWLLAALCRVGAGAAAGFIGGYGSHLAMDSLTPASLPLLA